MVRILKNILFQMADSFFEKFGYQIISSENLKSLEYFTLNIIQSDVTRDNSGINSIVFSRDRAMQLHAFLASYQAQVSNRGKMYILYKCTDLRHRNSYNQLIEIFANDDFVFVEEEYFRMQLIELLEQSDTGKIIFYVDDMVFTHRIDYGLFEKIDTRYNILSLSRGKDLLYSVVLKKSMELPHFTKIDDNLYRFVWNHQSDYNDWTYPLGVSGYMYGRTEIVSMLKAINFKAPNSLESGMQVYHPFFVNRFGLCLERAPCVCIHANMVQTEGENPVLGTFSPDELLELWEKGNRINLSKFYEKPVSVTQIQNFTFE